jgi:sugar lactone lactonase YvrE
MPKRIRLAMIAALVLCSASALAADKYRTDIVVPASPMHGVHGMAFGPDGGLYVCSLTGHSIYRVDVRSGAVTIHVDSPRGTCDDLAFAPDGTLSWTAGSYESVFARTTQGRIVTLAEGLPGLNSINYSKDGRLFVTQIFRADALLEVSPIADGTPPKLIAEKLGGLNGFEVAADGTLIGPLFLRGKVVKINIATGAVTDFAAGFMQPAAVNLDSKGRVIAVDYVTGEVVRFSPDGRTRQILATVPPPADNLAIASNDMIYVSSTANNGITEINPETGATRRITWGNISAVGNVKVVTQNGREQLLLADSWGPRYFDVQSQTMTPMPRGPGVLGASSLAVMGENIILSNIWPFGTVQVVGRESGKLVANLPGFGAPYDVRPIEDGFIVADFAADRLIKVANDENWTRSQAAFGLEGPVGLADAGKGVFYVTEYGKKDRRGDYQNGDVSRVDTATNTRTIIARKLKKPEGIALAPDGRLIVAEVGAQRVVAVDPTGKKKLEVLASDLDIGLDVGTRVAAPFLPTGVAVTSDGAIYVTGDVDNVLYRITKK